MTAPPASAKYVSFDGGVRASSTCYRPERYRFFDESRATIPMIPRGAGLSYAAASFENGSITVEHTAFNRFIAFSATDRTITVEAGMTLGQLATFVLPRGLYLATQPGHPSITIGGCVAADVHGKNHFRDGTFVSQVRSLQLFHPVVGTLTLSREQNRELFCLTCGGYGLTGHILQATLQLQPVQSSTVAMTSTPITDIFKLPEMLANVAESAELVYTWHNFTRRGDQFGQGTLTSGVFSDNAGLEIQTPSIPETNALQSESRGSFGMGFFNSLTTPLFNRVYQRAHRHRNGRRSLVPFYDFYFPVHSRQIYFKLFGSAGFHEFQHVIPLPRFGEYITAVKQRLEVHPLPVALASAKLFRGNADLLRFTGDGICMAIDVPRATGSLEFAQFLDELLPGLGAIPNIIKDSRLPQSVVARTYPQYELFRRQLHTFDPQRHYRSELSQRLQL